MCKNQWRSFKNWGITYRSVIINTLGKVVKSCLYTNNLVSNTYPLMYIYVHLNKCIFDSIVMKKGFGNKHLINENIPFHYRQYFEHVHVVASCSRTMASYPSRWKGYTSVVVGKDIYPFEIFGHLNLIYKCRQVVSCSSLRLCYHTVHHAYYIKKKYCMHINKKY